MPKITKIVDNASGVVRSFADGKGLINFEQFGDVTVEHTAIVFPENRKGNNYLRPAQNVICTIKCGPKGMFASNVKVVFQKKPGEASEDTKRPPSVTRPSTSTRDGIGAPPLTELDIIEKDLRGEVTEFDQTHRSGFVVIRQYGKLPCYADHIIFSGLVTTEDCLKPSQIVRCDVGRGKRGILFAVNIHVICDAPTEASGKDKAKKAAKEAPLEVATTKPEASQSKKTLEIIASDQLGEVTSYNPSGGTGHILVQGYDKLPVKTADVVGSKPLMPKQIVRVDIVRGPKTNVTSNVRIIADVPKNNIVQASQPSNEASKDQDMVAKDQLGEMVSFNPTHRNGHVKIQGFGNLIVNRSSLGDIQTLKPQQIVKCDVMRGPKSNFASNVRLISLIDFERKGKSKQTQNPQEKGKQPQNPHDKVKQPQNPQEKVKQPQNLHEMADKPQVQQNLDIPPPCAPPPMNPYFTHPQNPHQGQTNYLPGQQYPFHPYPGVAQPNVYPTQYPYPPNPNVDQCGYFSPPPMSHGFPGARDMPPPYQPSGQGPPPPQNVKVVPETTDEKSSKKKEKSKKIVENELANAVEKLKLICEICKDRLEDPVTIPCEHLFCRECLTEWLAVNPSCPVDGKAVSKKAVKAAPLKIRELATVFGELKVK